MAPAHRGYQYQDLVSALALVDVLVEQTTPPTIDRKLFEGDLFDDLTLTTSDGERHRMQIKHTSGAPRPLQLRNFTTTARHTRIDHLVLSLLRDRDDFPEHRDQTTYRLVFTDLAPTDSLLRVLLPEMRVELTGGIQLPTSPRSFDAKALLALRGGDLDTGGFASALSALQDLPEGDLEWACSRLVVETAAPSFTGDLSRPGPAEDLLLSRARDRIGAGTFPNQTRAPSDFAAGLILAAQSARTGKGEVDRASLSRRIQLRTDYGAVAVGSPVNQELQVDRRTFVDSLLGRVEHAASIGSPILITGPPGQGKSWVSDQLLTALGQKQWLVAAHYCYLGEADHERDDRVLLDSILGSLIGRLADADPLIVSENFPRFAADRLGLERALQMAAQRYPAGVALVIDGLDHISRVLRDSLATDASRVVCEALATLRIPKGVTLVVTSQPGDHLAPLGNIDRVALPGMTSMELAELTQRLLGETEVLRDSKFQEAIERRSSGNALYATYLCREALRRDLSFFPSGADAVLALPDFDGTLGNYYEYLYNSVESEAWIVAEWLAVAPFALTRAELKQLGHGHRVDRALTVLGPVVRDSVGSGIRFYHESFARFARERLSANAPAVAELLDGLSDWLRERGLFDDQRAFRWLLPILAERGRHTEVVDLVEDQFVERALMEAFSPRLILSNIARATASASTSGNWPAAARLVQIANSAHMFAFERLELLVEFTDVQCAFLHPQRMADRLLDDEHLTMTGREGLLRCAAVDALGAVAPWTEYIDAYNTERGDDNVYRGGDDQRQVALALLRGRLRLAAAERSPNNFDWEQLALLTDAIDAEAQQIFDVVDEVLGAQFIIRLARHSAQGAELLVILAEGDPTYQDAALAKLIDSGWESGWTQRVLSLGLDPRRLHATPEDLRAALLDATRSVVKGPSSSREGQLDEWLDLCAVAARIDALGLATAEALTQGAGWYRCWLGFAIELVRAEVSPAADAAQLAYVALTRLEADTDPFVGSPRACDLYAGHETISRTIERAIRLLDPGQWPDALALLGRVSQATTTILMGNSTGPVHADELARIVTKLATTSDNGSVRKHLLEQAENVAPNVYYAEVASHRLRLARLEVQGGDLETAQVHLKAGVELLLTYGSHKDSTIYEFLETLADLDRLDPHMAQKALGKLQDVTLAIQHHTDGRGTGHVHPDWWKEASSIDPRWLMGTGLAELYSDVNSTLWPLQEAFEQIWLAWKDRAHPRVAAAARLATDASLHPTDSADLIRYAEAGVGSTQAGRSLLRWLVARADERQTHSDYSNAREILDGVEAIASEFSTTAKALQLPGTLRVEPGRRSPVESERWGPSEIKRPIRESLTPEPALLAPGITGVHDTIRSLGQRGPGQPEHTAENLSNPIGYRLAELYETGRSGDAVQALFAIADAVPFSNSPELLASLGDGFTRLEMHELAAVASVLTWTRSRQDGGWKAFGGTNNLDHLARAFVEDSATAHNVLGRELARATLSSNIIGPTQALITAAANGALPSESIPEKIASECWLASFAVVNRRSPRLSESDRSSMPYVPTGVLSEDDEVNRVVAGVALAKLCLPGRESKRRALLAISDLLAVHPKSIVKDLSRCLVICSDPITQQALLEVAIEQASRSSTLLNELEPALHHLANSNLVAIRTAARSLLEQPPALPFGETRVTLVIPGIEADAFPLGESMIEEFLGERLRGLGDLIPEANAALLREIGPSVDNGAIHTRMGEQLDALTNRSRPHWPDAILAGEEECEREIQSLAGAVRASRLVSGEPVREAASWEREIAHRLELKTSLSLEIERSRHPRPNFLASPPPESSDWVPQSGSDYTHMEQDGKPVPLDGTDWVCVAYREERLHDTAHSDLEGTRSISMGGMWIDETRPRTLPLLTGAWDWWTPNLAGGPWPERNVGLVGQFSDSSLTTALGGSKHMLCPSPLLTKMLGATRSGGRLSMLDEKGRRVLRLVTWRAEYESHDLSYPRIEGQAIAIRRDSLNVLERKLASRLRFPGWRLMRATS